MFLLRYVVGTLNMESSLTAVQYLANSANRVGVLSTLVDERATRRELQDETDTSRSTVARILEEGQSRGWVDSAGSLYWLTPLGKTIVQDFLSYLETVEGIQSLGEMVNQFPPPMFSLDFRHLRDAVVVEPTPADPAAPNSRAFELFRQASHYRGVTHTAFQHFANVLSDGVEAGRLDYEHVFEKTFVEELRNDPQRATDWPTIMDGTWQYDGTVPISFHIIDGRVLIWLGESRDEIAGLLESDNGEVLAWAKSLFETYRSAAEPVTGW